jgi:hypothetical protein
VWHPRWKRKNNEPTGSGCAAPGFWHYGENDDMQFDDRKTARGFAALGGLVQNWREISQFLAKYNKKYLGKIGKMGVSTTGGHLYTQRKRCFESCFCSSCRI